MRTQLESERAFAAAIRDPLLVPPNFLCAAEDCALPGRFAVYRNNVAVALIDSLRSRFPVTARLVGDDFFDATARVYAFEHPPRDAVLMRWGDTFADFLASFPPAAGVAYLPDIARLETAWNRAYHAAEAVALEPDTELFSSAERLAADRLVPHPSAGILTSQHPIATIWASHQHGQHVTRPAIWRPEDVLVVRPRTQVHVHSIESGSACFIGSLFNGAGIGVAAADASARHPDFNAASCLYGLFRAGAIIGIEKGQPQGA